MKLAVNRHSGDGRLSSFLQFIYFCNSKFFNFKAAKSREFQLEQLIDGLDFPL